MTFDAIVLAAGAGDRFGGPGPKQFEHLAGIPILVRAARAAVAGGAARVVVVVSRDRLEQARALFGERARGASAPDAPARVAAGGPALTFVAGGATRVDSTRLGLASLEDGAEVVVVHDAARPLASAVLFERVVAAVGAGADAATVAVASADTVGRVVEDALVEILERSRLARVQTPQAFRREVLVEAHRRAAAAADTASTDDCGLVLRHVAGARIACVAGDDANLKITTPRDLQLAEALLAGA